MRTCWIGGVVLGLVSSAMADVVYVRANLTTGLNNGTSWANAYRGSEGLRTALASALPGTEVWVSQGTYTPAPPGGSREAGFVLPSEVRLIGGFVGNESSLNQRNQVVNRTILSGDLSENDGASGPGSDNSAHVVIVSGTSHGTVIDGVTIRAGNARDYGPSNQVARDDGAGVLATGAVLALVGCVLEGNYARSGGGVFIQRGQVTAEYCTFVGNTGTSHGAGATVTDGGTLELRNSVFQANIGGSGVGVYSGPVAQIATLPGDVLVDFCQFRANTGMIGATSGGGILSFGGLEVHSSVFERNASNGGGGVSVFAGEARIGNSRFIANQANGDLGDGLYVRGIDNAEGWPRVQAINCLFTGHRFIANPRADGTPIFTTNAELELLNCTVAGNGGSQAAGAVAVASGELRVDNCIIWDNTGRRGQTQLDGLWISTFGNPTVTVNNTLLQGWTGGVPGSGVFAADPNFVDPDGADDVAGTIDDDYGLRAGSPAIDQGLSEALPADVVVDLAGSDRTRQDASVPDGVGGQPQPVDCGALEFQASCPADFNQDGFGDFFDYDAFVACFEAGRCPEGTTPDFNADGFVDFFDYDAFVEAFEAGC
jgi:hypothetical protein